MIISIPPKFAVSEIVGCIKGKSAIAIARESGSHKLMVNLWVRDYVKNQEQLDGLGAEENGEF